MSIKDISKFAISTTPQESFKHESDATKKYWHHQPLNTLPPCDYISLIFFLFISLQVSAVDIDARIKALDLVSISVTMFTFFMKLVIEASTYQ